MTIWKRLATATASFVTLGFASLPIPTLAVELTFQYSGTVDDVYDYNDTDLINLGDPITGTYTFDSDTIDTDPDPNAGEYSFDSALKSTINMGNYKTESSTNYIYIINDFQFNHFQEVLDYYYVDLEEGDSYAGVTLENFSATAFSSDSLSSSPPIISDFDSIEFDFENSEYEVSGTINSIENITPATPVPFEFSPSLGIVALGALYGATQLKSKVKKLRLSNSTVLHK